VTLPKRRSLPSEEQTAQIHEIMPKTTPLTDDFGVVGHISVRREWAKKVRKGAKQKLLGAEGSEADTGYAEQLLYARKQRRA
jgi:hypothetical protein